MLSLTSTRPRGRRDSYTQEDEFCADLDRRLFLIQQWKKKEKDIRGSPQPWNPYPDAIHSSSLETHVHRLSSAKTDDMTESEFSATPPPQLQKQRGWRKLSTDGVYRVDAFRPLTAVDRRCQQDRNLTRSEEAEWEDSQTSSLTAQEWARQEGFIFPQPAPPPPIKHPVNQQIRQAMVRRAQARLPRGKTSQTHYQRFDEGDFGRRILDTAPSKPRRRSLLSAEIRNQESETEDSDEPARSQSSIPTVKPTRA